MSGSKPANSGSEESKDSPASSGASMGLDSSAPREPSMAAIAAVASRIIPLDLEPGMGVDVNSSSRTPLANSFTLMLSSEEIRSSELELAKAWTARWATSRTSRSRWRSCRLADLICSITAKNGRRSSRSDTTSQLVPSSLMRSVGRTRFSTIQRCSVGKSFTL